MAEAREELILEINVSNSVTQLAELRQELDKLISKREELSEKSKAGDIGATKELEKLNSTIRNTQQEYKAQQRVLDGYEKAQKLNINTSNLAANSIDANTAHLKQLTAQYKALSNPSANATAQIKHLSDVLKEQEAAIGNTSRNVGNYKESILGALSGLNVFGKNLGSVIDPLRNMGATFQSAGGGVQGFSAALLATGLPVFIAGVQGAISIMQKFDSVTEGVEDTFNGLNHSFDFFIGHAEEINNASLPEMINLLKGAYDEGVKLSQVMRQLAEAQDFQRVSNAQANKEVEALIIKSKDRTVAEKDRIAFLDEASAKEKKNLEENLKLAEQRVKLAQDEFKRVIEAGLADDKAKKALNDANVEFINLQRESGNLQEKILGRRNALLDEIAKNEEQANSKRREELKKIQEEEAKIAELNLKNEQQIVIEQSKLSDERIRKAKEEADALLKIKQDADKEQLELQNQTSAAFLKSQQEEVDATRQAEAAKIQYQQASLQSAGGIANSIIGLVGQVAEAQGAGAEFAKALAFVQILTQQAIAIATAVAGATQSGAATGPGAIGAIPAFIATLVGAVIAVVGGAIGLLSKPIPSKPAKFALGGDASADSILIGGRSHSQGGTKYFGEDGNVFEAEKNERIFIMKRDASENIGLLSKWNQFFGGRSFTGSPVKHAADGGFISDGGFATRELTKGIDFNIMMTEAIKKGFALAPAPQLSIVELESKQSSRNRSVKVSEA